MYRYLTLENVTNELLCDTFLEAFQGFPILSKTDIDDFNTLLKSNEYDPVLSVGAFNADTNELVAFVLNSITNEENEPAAYSILTGTKPVYRRRGIASHLFKKSKEILRQKGVTRYCTEVLVNNVAALHFYQAQGFEIKNRVMTLVPSKEGAEQVLQYAIAASL